jgi:hypothetical protein
MNKLHAVWALSTRANRGLFCARGFKVICMKSMENPVPMRLVWHVNCEQELQTHEQERHERFPFVHIQVSTWVCNTVRHFFGVDFLYLRLGYVNGFI